MKNALLMIAVAVGAFALPVPAGAAPVVNMYVALGDSYAAVGDLTDVHGTPGCFRSRRNYPAFVAAAIAPARFVDASCGDARTTHMTTPQQVVPGVNPPQLDALTADTDLVTINIGANDLDLPATLAPCIALAVTELRGNPCERYYVRDGVDRLAQRIDNEVAPAIATVLREVRARAPGATIAVVGYPAPLPPTGGCFPSAPVAAGDVPYLYASMRRLTLAMMAAAEAVGALGVDVSAVPGHDMCQPVGVRWIEPLVPATATTPFHPNVLGAQSIADLIESALRR